MQQRSQEGLLNIMREARTNKTSVDADSKNIVKKRPTQKPQEPLDDDIIAVDYK